MKKIVLSLVLALCIAFGAALCAQAASSGICGDNLTWTLDENGTLTISGSGEMYDYIDKFYQYTTSNGTWTVSKNENDGIGGYQEFVTSNGAYLIPIYENPDEDLQYYEIVTDNGAYLVNNKSSYKEIVTANGAWLVEDDGRTWVEYFCSDGCCVFLIDPNETFAEIQTGYGWHVLVQGGVPWLEFENDIKKIVIGKDVTGLDHSLWVSAGFNLTEFSVDSENENYKSSDGILYAGDFETLLKNPASNPVSDVIIPDSVTSIEDYAFEDCTNLKSIKIPLSVTSIGVDVFNYCQNLTVYGYAGSTAETYAEENDITFIAIDAVTTWQVGANLTATLYDDGTLKISGTGAMPDWTYASSVPWYSDSSLIKKVIIDDGVESIGARAFYNSRNIESVVIADSVTSIGISAFYYCTSLESVAFGKNSKLVSIGNSAFDNCASLTSIVIPKSVTNIGSFTNCTGLTSIEIPDGVTSIYPFAFKGCSNLESVVIPDSVTIIYASAFAGCSKLTSIEIPAGVTSIYDSAFSSCTGITSITFGENSKLTSIGNEAFKDCFDLISIEIPAGVTSIGERAFDRCTSLESILVDSNNANYSSDERGALFNKDKTTLIQYPLGNIATSYEIPLRVVSISDSAFESSKNLENIVISDSVTTLGEYVFSACKKLENIKISKNITRISSYTFQHCTSLKNIVIPDSVTSLGEYVFYKCTNLESVEIPASVTSIAFYAFYDSGNRTIYGYAGSTAESFAESKAIPFEYVNRLEAALETGKYTVSAIYGGEEISGKIAAALYNDDGKMLEMHFYDAAENVPVEFENTVSKGTARFMWLSEYDGITPKCKNVTIDI